MQVLRKLDLSELDFSGCDVSHLNLSYTSTNINLQTIKDKCLWATICTSLDFKNKDFIGVSVAFANLENTDAYSPKESNPFKIMEDKKEETLI